MTAGKVNTTRSEIFAANKQAFDDVFGNPFAKPEPFTGQYQILKGRGQIAAMQYSDEGRATRNPAKPNLMDFFCDVENIITRNLDSVEQAKFQATYIYESGPNQFTDKERSEVEQKLGRLLRARKISPVSRYFKTIRQAGISRRK